MTNKITLKQCLGIEATSEFEPDDCFALAHAAEQLECCQHLCNPMPAIHQAHPKDLPWTDSLQPCAAADTCQRITLTIHVMQVAGA